MASIEPQPQEDNKKYVILRTLGKGSFGKVKEALHVKTGQKLAIKILEKERIRSNDDKIRVRREIEIHSRLIHPNITQLYEVNSINKTKFFRSLKPANIFFSLWNIQKKET